MANYYDGAGSERGSMHPRSGPHLLQLLHRPQYPLPHRVAVQVALLKHGVGPHGSFDRRVNAVPATAARAGLASRHWAMVSARMLPHTLPLRSGEIVQAELSSALLCWWRLAARPAEQYEEHNQHDDHRSAPQNPLVLKEVHGHLPCRSRNPHVHDNR